MNKNPTVNALLAAVYISILSSIVYFSPHYAHPTQSVFMPIVFLSVFTLSPGVMIYLFILTPFRMYIDGDKQNALKWFMKALVSFAVITIIFGISLLVVGK